MKNYNRFTEPENLIEQSGSLKLKWAAVIAVIGIALLIFLSGCSDANEHRKKAAINEMNIYVFDSCEYVGMNLSWQSAVLVHKGNCKYCIQREGDTIK